MKKLFTLIALILSSNLFAQFTITSAYNPVPGNSMLGIGCDTAGINEGGSGANQSWNFSGIVTQDSSTQNWVSASSTPYAAQFPTSNLAATVDNSFFSYFTSTSSALLSDGYAGTSLVNYYSDPQTYLEYPFTYNSTFTDNFASSFMSTGFTIYRRGTSTVTGDAWGTITLPSGSFSNSLRVRFDNTMTDSSFIGVPFLTVTTQTSYLWFVPDKKFSVFQIDYIEVVVNGMLTSSTKVVVYNPNNPSIGITQLGTSVPGEFRLFQNYPNPFNPSTKIRFDISSAELSGRSNVVLSVYDELGREVTKLVNENLSPGNYEVDWNAENLPGGVYFYRLTAGNYTVSRKMLLVK